MMEVMAERIIEIVNDTIEDVKISKDQIDADLTELGLDSIQFIQIIVMLEEAFDCEIPDSKLLITEMNTVQKMIDVLQELYGEQSK